MQTKNMALTFFLSGFSARASHAEKAPPDKRRSERFRMAGKRGTGDKKEANRPLSLTGWLLSLTVLLRRLDMDQLAELSFC